MSPVRTQRHPTAISLWRPLDDIKQTSVRFRDSLRYFEKQETLQSSYWNRKQKKKNVHNVAAAAGAAGVAVHNVAAAGAGAVCTGQLHAHLSTLPPVMSCALTLLDVGQVLRTGYQN